MTEFEKELLSKIDNINKKIELLEKETKETKEKLDDIDRKIMALGKVDSSIYKILNVLSKETREKYDIFKKFGIHIEKKINKIRNDANWTKNYFERTLDTDTLQSFMRISVRDATYSKEKLDAAFSRIKESFEDIESLIQYGKKKDRVPKNFFYKSFMD